MSDVRGKLAKVARERGQTVEDMLDEAVNIHKSVNRVAAALGVAPNAITQWLRRNDYEIRVVRRAEMVKVVR